MGSVTYLIGRLKNGSSSAFAGLMERYYARQVRQARRHLHGSQAGVMDADDVAHVAFWRLWQGVSDQSRLGRFLSDTTSLLKVLATLTRDQVSRARRDAQRDCRDHRRTRPLVEGDEESVLIEELADNPWPVVIRAMDSREEVERLIAVLPQERHKQFVRLVLEERPLAEIAGTLNCSVRTVQRLNAEIEDLWRSNPQGPGNADA
jgi:RNA polymerase sigma factor (sigma-70 family)